MIESMQVDLIRFTFADFFFPFESHMISFRVTGKHFNANTHVDSFVNFTHYDELVKIR